MPYFCFFCLFRYCLKKKENTFFQQCKYKPRFLYFKFWIVGDYNIIIRPFCFFSNGMWRNVQHEMRVWISQQRMSSLLMRPRSVRGKKNVYAEHSFYIIVSLHAYPVPVHANDVTINTDNYRCARLTRTFGKTYFIILYSVKVLLNSISNVCTKVVL